MNQLSEKALYKEIDRLKKENIEIQKRLQEIEAEQYAYELGLIENNKHIKEIEEDLSK